MANSSPFPGGDATCGEIAELIASHAHHAPQSPALLAEGMTPLSYAGLHQLIRNTHARLAQGGIGPGDRVAIVLPNGPEMAAAFLAVASYATAAPLNPAYTRQEVEFYLEDLGARVVIVAAGVESPAVEAAEALGIGVLNLHAEKSAAGAFTLSGVESLHACDDDELHGEAALVLHTSGTTSRPKIVPLAQANLLHSAASIAASLELTAADRCLNVMPLFHIHGLIGALLSSLHAGGSVLCARSNDPRALVENLEKHEATWYTAVPTLHQAVLAASPEGGKPARLRFIRSCSAPLPPAVMQRLEARFHVPVVEAYGMTEASHQMTCNPLPPGRRKPGSVGVATGLEVAIMDAAGALLPTGTTGEVVIRGAGVTAGYEGNRSANAESFTHGWFRTGDQGYLDAEGYLFLTGRIKELINRGGEKISPREIDDVLVQHPAIAQAAAFSMPHASLGEEVAAGVVLRSGATATEEEVQRHVAAHLAAFKVPQRVVFVSELPKGPTGKPQRIGMAEKLAAALALPSTPAAGTKQVELTATGKRLRKLWSGILGHDAFTAEHTFFQAGGNSLTGSLLLVQIAKEFGVELPVRTLFTHGTLAALAEAIDHFEPGKAESEPRFEFLVPFQMSGKRPPYFMVHGHSGRSLGLGFIAPYLEDDQPYYGFVARGMDGRRLPHSDFASMARDYIAEMRRVQPHGPYYLGGFCSGGHIAYEMAQQLRAGGEEVALLMLLDTAHPRVYKPQRPLTTFLRYVKRTVRRGLFRALTLLRGRATVRLGERIVNETNRRGAMTYVPADYPAPLTLIRSESHARTEDFELGWNGTISGEIVVHPIPGEHAVIFTPAHIEPAARAMQKRLNQVQQERRSANSERETARRAA